MRLEHKQINPVVRFSGQENSKANEDCTLFKCSVCKEQKSIDKFFKNKSKAQGITAACKPCHQNIRRNLIKRGRMKGWSKNAYKNHGRKYHLLKAYGITPEVYDEMRIAQAHQCAICDKHESELGEILHIDHCHTTGKLRGLLCRKCNHAIGLLKENITSFQRSIEYLQRPR